MRCVISNLQAWALQQQEVFARWRLRERKQVHKQQGMDLTSISRLVDLAREE
jgi:hypothetical protein